MITSNIIYELVKVNSGEDIFRKTRKRDVIELRAAANVLCREYTDETFGSIGMNSGVTHATVLYSTKMFEEVYKIYSKPVKKVYDEINEILKSYQERNESKELFDYYDNCIKKEKI